MADCRAESCARPDKTGHAFAGPPEALWRPARFGRAKGDKGCCGNGRRRGGGGPRPIVASRPRPGETRRRRARPGARLTASSGSYVAFRTCGRHGRGRARERPTARAGAGKGKGAGGERERGGVEASRSLKSLTHHFRYDLVDGDLNHVIPHVRKCPLKIRKSFMQAIFVVARCRLSDISDRFCRFVADFYRQV